MTRQEAVDKLCDVYAGSFDVTRHEEARQPLMATMDFFSSTTPSTSSPRKRSCGRPTALNMCTCSACRT